MIKKLLGILMVIIGILGIGLSIAVTVIVNRTIDSIGNGLDHNLTLTLDSLDTVKDSLELTQTTVGQVNEGLETVEDTASNISQTMADTEPLLDAVADVTSESLPDSIESFQSAVPNMAGVAGAIDDTLTTLSDFEIDEEIFGVGLQFDLGIDYEPDEPFEDSITSLGTSLDGVPEQLRGLETHIDTTTANLLTISENIDEIGSNLDTINSSIGEIGPLLDEYIGLIDQLKDSTERVQDDLDTQLQNVRMGLSIIFIWMALLNVPPLYIGAELLSNKRQNRDNDDEIDEEDEDNNESEDTDTADNESADDESE